MWTSGDNLINHLRLGCSGTMGTGSDKPIRVAAPEGQMGKRQKRGPDKERGAVHRKVQGYVGALIWRGTQKGSKGIEAGTWGEWLTGAQEHRRREEGKTLLRMRSLRGRVAASTLP
jgi:hypothetical protein